MARRSRTLPSPRTLTLSLAVIVAAVVWITASTSERPSEPTAAKTTGAVATPGQAAAVAQAPTTAPHSTPLPQTVVARAAEPSDSEAQTPEEQEALAWDAIDVPLTLPTFESAPDAFPAMTGIRAVLDPVTGKLTVPSEEERRRMAEQMKGFWPPLDDQSLVGQTFPNGGQIVPLDERHMEFVRVEKGPDGKLRTRCVSGSQPPVAGTAGAAPGDR